MILSKGCSKMSEKYLIMSLISPLQSWGLMGCFDDRDTSMFPTKSAIVGLLCSALGIDRGDEESISEIAKLTLSIIQYQRGIVHTDFHTVGHRHKDPLFRLRTAENKPKHGAVTHRDYLSDAKFIVILSGEASVIDRCAAALDNPKWSTFLGRRSCVPASPLLENVFGTEREVSSYLEGKGVHQGMLCQSDSDSGLSQMDFPINFKKRSFAPRFVSEECSFIR